MAAILGPQSGVGCMGLLDGGLFYAFPMLYSRIFPYRCSYINRFYSVCHPLCRPIAFFAVTFLQLLSLAELLTQVVKCREERRQITFPVALQIQAFAPPAG
jgi:hypothetical protein